MRLYPLLFLLVILCSLLLNASCEQNQAFEPLPGFGEDEQSGPDQSVPEKKEPLVIPPEYYSKDEYKSLSVIIPAHNTASYVWTTLESVDASVQAFFEGVTGAREVKVEVVIVDDASTDNTVAVITNFIEQQRKKGITNPEWKLVALHVNVLGGAARNFGVRASTGEILFFCDSDDLYLPNHIGSCWNAITANHKLGMVQTQAEVEVPNIHPDWKRRVEGTIPLTKCIKRKVHEFIEGFPEQGVFTRHQDIGYLQALSGMKVPYGKLKVVTTVYKRYPGNSLDTQMKKFQSDPQEKQKSDEEKTEEYPIRMMIIQDHINHVSAKVAAYHEGLPLKENELWAIYQNYLNTNKIDDWGLVNMRKLKYKRLVQVADEMMLRGELEKAKQVMRITHKFIYDANEKQFPFYYQVSSLNTTCAAGPLHPQHADRTDRKSVV